MTPTPAGRFNNRIIDERMGQKDKGDKEEERNKVGEPQGRN